MSGTPDGPADGMAPGRTTRRGFLLAGGTAVLSTAAVLLAGDRRGTPRSPQLMMTDSATPVAATAGPTTLSGVLELADDTVGRRMLGSPWNGWAGSAASAWSGTYATWLLRGTGVAATADVAALREQFLRLGRTGATPQRGALVFYHRGDPRWPFHVGLVTSVTSGVPQSVEGSHPWSLPPAERFVRRFSLPWDPRVDYGYPAYA
jgi:hypothetical protein